MRRISQSSLCKIPVCHESKYFMDWMYSSFPSLTTAGQEIISDGQEGDEEPHQHVRRREGNCVNGERAESVASVNIPMCMQSNSLKKSKGGVNSVNVEKLPNLYAQCSIHHLKIKLNKPQTTNSFRTSSKSGGKVHNLKLQLEFWKQL